MPVEDDVPSFQSKNYSIKSGGLKPQIISISSQFNTLPSYNESVMSELPKMTNRKSVESLSNAPSDVDGQNLQQLLSKK